MSLIGSHNLYQEVILTLNNSPLNYGKIDGHCAKTIYHNQMCGDTVELHVIFSEHEEFTIEKILFSGESCAITKASASLMTTAIKGKNINQTMDIIKAFRNLIDNRHSQTEEKDLGKLNIFKSLEKYPSRYNCAILPWKALEQLFEEEI